MCRSELFQLKFKTLIFAVSLVLISEVLFLIILNHILMPIVSILILRLIQIIGLSLILKPKQLNLKQGFKTGFIWSVIFGSIALILYFSLNFAGINPLKYIKVVLPKNNLEIVLFFITAGLISPIAEELFFRGFIYVYFRKFNFFLGLILSTTLFALPHFQSSTFPIIPIIGGIVFALSYEHSKSLIAPIIIHVLGNLTIFFLSL